MSPKTSAKKLLLWSLASLILFSLATESSIAVAPVLPTPVLAFTGQENYQANGQRWTRYKLSVTNHAAYPNDMFAPAPNLPPCGQNASSSRTWVDIYDKPGKRLYGFCALNSADGLTDLWFAVPLGPAPPPPGHYHVYVVLNDRQTNRKYISNVVAIP